ncbi:MAG TPA: hypothetical protein VFU26_15470 [Gaiellaceae bacterium]|nr:hypothetical protein [Gaiellaceae bacterium]
MISIHSASLRRVALGAASAALLLPSAAFGEAKPVTPPAIRGVAALPGPVVDPGKPAAAMGVLKTKPDIALPGTPVTISGKGLPAAKEVTLVWSTANVDWVLDPRPDSVDYLGRKATKFAVRLALARTDTAGSFSVKLKAPADFGGIHDVYAVVDGLQVAKGGLLIARSASISPKQGPIGTMITVTYTGLGSSLYEGGASLLYDNKYVGAVMANWTRGVAKVRIRAAGPVGRHTIEIADAISFKYLNIQQSPIPWGTGFKFAFTVTKDRGRPAPQIDWPAAVAATVDSRTTLDAANLTVGTSGAAATLSTTSGQVLSKVNVTATGLTPNEPVELAWSTVVGNRVNCTGTCWSFVSVPLATAKASASGSLTRAIQVPDGLGGWHVVQLSQAGQVKAQVPFFVKRSFVGKGVSRLVLKEGQPFTIHLKGVGWTQLDNTIAVNYDNSYVGYGCGFNSNGDVVMNMVATGGPGTHLIDMYPLLYTQQPSYANTPYGMVPVLTYERDAPGLALGYQLPAMRLAITIVP